MQTTMYKINNKANKAEANIDIVFIISKLNVIYKVSNICCITKINISKKYFSFQLKNKTPSLIFFYPLQLQQSLIYAYVNTCTSGS